MRFWTRLLRLLPSRRNAAEADMREELEALREMAEPGELGNLTLAAEDARAEWSWPRLERIARDFRMALWTLGRSPGYTAACIGILALGIGANTAIFSVVNAVVLKPLPYPESNRLVFVWQKMPELPEPIGPRMQASRLTYQEWGRQPEIFEGMEAFQVATLNETGVERPRSLSTAYTSANFFSLLGASPALGRLFRSEEQEKGSDDVVILSDAYFDQRFHRDPSALGKSIALGRNQYTIVGVLPRRFRLPAFYQGDNQVTPDVWLPLSRLWKRPADDTSIQLFVIARLKPLVSLDQSRVTMSGVQSRLHKSNPERFPLEQASVFPFLVEDKSEDLNQALFILLGAVGLLLLIGCANLANLTMARATRRAREISIRRALGASRGRIVAQLLTESFVVSAAGTAVGMLLAQLTRQALLRSNVPVPRPEEIEMNWPVFVFAASVSVLTTFLFGLAPAITASRVSLNEALKSRGGGGASASLATSRYVLTAVEVALAVVLLCGSGLLIRSFTKLVQTGLGFRTEKLGVIDIDLPETRYPDAAGRARFYDALVARARAVPGVAVATASTTLPLKGINFQTFTIAGRPKPAPSETPNADVARIGIDYFQLMELPISAGRNFRPADVTRNRKSKGDGVVIVNQAFAAKFFNGQSPLGQRLELENDRLFEIVGVTANFLAMGALSEARPQFFVAGIEAPKGLLLLRTQIPFESISNQIRATLLSLDPDLPVNQIYSLDHIIREQLAAPRSVVILMGAFAALALLLAMIGVYSVLANLVASRTRELGIRIALGASTAHVRRLVAGQSLKPLAIGLVLGLAGSLALSRVLTSFLIGVAPNDPLTFALSVGAVVLVAPFAVWGPMRRATSVECTVALREE